ncbi:hypothetical protein D3C84_534690 [compost metagenome]
MGKIVAADTFLTHIPEFHCPCFKRRTRSCISLFRLLGWVSIASAPGSKMHRQQHIRNQRLILIFLNDVPRILSGLFKQVPRDATTLIGADVASYLNRRLSACARQHAKRAATCAEPRAVNSSHYYCKTS